MKWNPNEVAFFEQEPTAPYPSLLKSYHDSTYAWQPGMEKHLRISKSSLSNFLWCPQQYFFSSICNIPQEDTEPLIRGTNVHAIVEYYWDNVGEVLDEAIDLLKDGKTNMARKALYDVIPKPPSPYVYGEEEVIDRWFEWQFSRFKITEGKNWLPIGNEVPVHAKIMIDIDGEEIPVHLRGFIDTIFADGSGGFVLMELKTGKWTPKKAKSMREEMQFYRLALEEGGYNNYLPITFWAWEFPNGAVGNGVRPEWEIEEIGKRLTSYAPKTVMNNIKKLVKAHIKNEFPPIHNESCKRYCRHAEWCGNCSYMEICPAWSGEILEKMEREIHESFE